MKPVRVPVRVPRVNRWCQASFSPSFSQTLRYTHDPISMAASSLSSIPSASFQFFGIPKPYKNSKMKPHPPISISTNPSHLNPLHLRDLLAASDLSCHRFPSLGPDGRPVPADLLKLRTALAHSSVVVSVFCSSNFLTGGGDSGFGLEELFERMPGPPGAGRRLVGFGRAVSDGGLTASIHDIVVIHALRKLGIGRKIVERIIRVLTNKGIYDISALCSEKERLFFEACGFGEDSLGSTTMMYTRTAPASSQDNTIVRQAGQMMLLVPSSPHSCISKRTSVKAEDKIDASDRLL